MKVTASYHHIRNARTRFVIEQGGTGAGKTWNILLALIDLCAANENAGAVIAIVRKTGPALKATVYRDFLSILEAEDIYREADHNKSDKTYNLFGNIIEFISVDEPQKMRGRKRQVCYINEANELTYEDFFQLNIRTTEKVIIDFNPSHIFWAITELKEKQPDQVTFNIVTYRDNPFLSPTIVNEIQRLENISHSHYLIYNRGEFAPSADLVYDNWQVVNEMPNHVKLLGYGLDFGFTNDPAALVAMYKGDGGIYVKELIYESGLTNSDLAAKMKGLGIKGHDMVICDSAEPKSIEDLRRAGFQAIGAKKGADSVRNGIDQIKRHKLFIPNSSTNLITEFRQYRYKSNALGKVISGAAPVDMFNHAMDAMRYAASEVLAGRGQYVIG